MIESACATLYAQGKLDAIGDFFCRDYIAHIASEDLPLGHDGIRKVLGTYSRAFPDLAIEVQILVQDSDRIAWLRTLSGTHLGAFKGFPPTQRPIVWRDMVTSKFRDGLIAEEWIVSGLAESLLAARKR